MNSLVHEAVSDVSQECSEARKKGNNGPHRPVVLHGWMDGWMDGWVGEWMDRGMDEWVNGWIKGWVDIVVNI
jgi:hypothetical protein